MEPASRNAMRDGGVVQQGEQVRAVDANAKDQARHVIVSRVEHALAGRILAPQPVDPRPAVKGRPGETEAVEHRHAGRLKEQSRTERARLHEALVNGDGVAIAGKQGAGAQPSDSAPGDGDVAALHGNGLDAKVPPTQNRKSSAGGLRVGADGFEPPTYSV